MFNTGEGFTLIVVAVSHRDKRVHICSQVDVRSAHDVDIPASEMKYVGDRLAETMKMVLDDAMKRGRRSRSTHKRLVRR